MNDFEDLLRQTYQDHAPDAPDHLDLSGVVRAAAARRRRARLGVSAAVLAALAALGGAFTTTWLRPGELTPGAGSSAPKPARTQGTVDLVTTGECAGLQLTATLASGGGNWRISPGSGDNLIAMSGNQLLYLTGSGPCVDRLRFHFTDVALLQGADPNVDASPNSDGVAVVTSHAPVGGTATADVYGICQEGKPCYPDGPPLATVIFNLSPAALWTTTPLATP